MALLDEEVAGEKDFLSRDILNRYKEAVRKALKRCQKDKPKVATKAIHHAPELKAPIENATVHVEEGDCFSPLRIAGL